MLCLQLANRLGVFEPFGERVNQDRIQAVDRFAVVFEHLCGMGGDIGHCGVSKGARRQTFDPSTWP
jgi:hypothetical protein